MSKKNNDPTPSDHPMAMKRQAILEAAVRSFQRYGFDGTSMDRIAEETPASKRTVYNHFPSKDALFSAVVAELISRGRPRTEIAFEPDSSPESQLARFARAKHEHATDPRFAALFRVMITVVITRPKLAQEVVMAFEQGYEPLESWMRAANEAGVLEIENPVLDARIFSGWAAGLLFWPQVLGAKLPTERREQLIESVASDFVRARRR
ncbi:MAG: TetR/AcrR family transcriptional regulator [Planctomycetota bacterium]